MRVLSRHGRLLDFHRPEKLGAPHLLKPEAISCLRNLSAYRRPPAPGRYPRSRSAAVLVALFVGRGGDLYALLSRRSNDLRSYPGDTSLPGGKLERRDRSIENAARREAFEEIGLPLDKTKVPLLCILEPFLAGNLTIVTPVVVLITDQTLRPILNTSEVESIFSHPLQSFLATTPIQEPEPHNLPANDERERRSQDRSFVAQDSHYLQLQSSPQSQTPHDYGPASSSYASKTTEQPYHTYHDLPWYDKHIRIHRFLTGRESEGVKPIYGLTAAILIRTAQIGYARDPTFELYAPGQPMLPERIRTAIREEAVLRDACWAEGIERDWGLRHEGKRRGQRSKEDIQGSDIKPKRLTRL